MSSFRRKNLSNVATKICENQGIKLEKPFDNGAIIERLKKRDEERLGADKMKVI